MVKLVGGEEEGLVCGAQQGVRGDVGEAGQAGRGQWGASPAPHHIPDTHQHKDQIRIVMKLLYIIQNCLR